MTMSILVHEEFYASVIVNEDGSRKIFIGDYDAPPDKEKAAENTVGLYINMNDFQKFIDHYAEIEDHVLSFVKSSAQQQKKREREDDDNKKETQSKKKKHGKGKQEKKKPKYMSKKPKDLKLKIPKRDIVCDEVESKERQEKMENMLLQNYAKAIADQLETMVKEKCFGCQHDCPSQRDHDVCLDMLYSEIIEHYLDEAILRVDNEDVMKCSFEAFHELDPPPGSLDMMKYNNASWFDEYLKSGSNVKQLKQVLLTL